MKLTDALRSVKPGELLVVLIALAPALVAMPVLLSPWPPDASAWLRVGGKLTAILGLSCLLLAGILAVRVPGFDRWFGGLTRLWRLHHWLGTLSFLFIMLHPVLLAFAAVPAGMQVAGMVLFPPFGFWATWLGWLALLAMMVFLAPSYSFFGPPKYQRWKRMHLVSGAALVLGAIHGYALNTVFVDAGNMLVWGGLGLLAILAFGWRAVVSKKAARKPWRIKAVEPLAEGVVELVLEPLGRPLSHAAGQFVYFTPHDPALAAGRNEEHPYTISSEPQSDEMRIAIKDLGDASGALQTVTPGSLAHVDGPYGHFFRVGVEESELWLGGGIGMTPFVGRARELAYAGKPVDIRLVYCAQDVSRAYFLAELEDIAKRIEGFTVTPHFFADEGPLAEPFLAAHVPDYAKRMAYICGPLPMIRLARRMLREAGVPPFRIRSEEFELL